MSQKFLPFDDGEESPEYEQLIKDLKGRHASRMNSMLDELPDRQFRIVYPKLLEFCVGKPQRYELPKPANEDNKVLRIEIITSPKQLEEPAIDVEAKTVDKE